MINSCRKGKRCERQVRDLFRENGYLKARRGRQYSGSPDSPDVVIPELPGIHVEAKCVEHLNLRDAIEQAQRDAGDDQIPVVFHKRNNSPWLVTMTADDWFVMCREWMPPCLKENQGGDLTGMEV